MFPCLHTLEGVLNNCCVYVDFNKSLVCGVFVGLGYIIDCKNLNEFLLFCIVFAEISKSSWRTLM